MHFSEFQLGESYNLILSIFVVLLVVVSVYRKKKEYTHLSKIQPRISRTMSRLENPAYALPSFALIIIISVLLLISTLRPQYGYELVEGVQEGVDLIIAADVSESMLVEDVKPDRLSFQRRKINDLLQMIQGDRVSLVSFAGASFIETPLTLDYGSITSIIETLATDLVPLKGSNFDSIAGSAISLFNRNVPNQTSKDRSRAVIIFSDGEFEEGTLENGLQSLQKNQITPYLILIGSEQGGLIPSVNGFKKNKDGSPIISKADLTSLKETFSSYGGLAIRASLTDADLKDIYINNIKNSLKQDKLKYNNVRKWHEYYQLSLCISLVLLFIAWKTRKYIAIHTVVTILTIHMILPQTASAQTTDTNLHKGYQMYEAGKFSEALEYFSTIPEGSYEKHVASGNTYYRLGDFSKAEQEFGKAQSLAQTPQERSKALFNGANASTQLGNYKKALTSYQQAKKENPKDEEVETNIQYVKKLIQEEEKKDQKDEDNSSEENQQNQGTNSENTSSSQNNTKDSTSPEEDKNKQENQNDRQDKKSDNNSDNTSDKQENNNLDDKPHQDKNTERPQASQENLKQTNNTQTENKDTSNQMTNDQLESQLESLDENTEARNQYRYKKALEQLERENRNFPKMDW